MSCRLNALDASPGVETADLNPEINIYGHPQLFRYHYRTKTPVCPKCNVQVPLNQGEGMECDSCRKESLFEA